MKRIFTLSVLLVVSGLLLPACGTHMTIAKRQHSKGYYVDISSDKKSAKTDAKTVRELEENEEIIAETRHEEKPKHAVKRAEVAEAVVVEETAVAETQTEAATETATVEEQTASAEKPLSVPAGKSALQTEKSSVKSLTSNLKQEAKKFTQSSKIKKMQQSQRADGLSLFWIVILILLILWLLGLLGGLGWFIHIALIVALIFLILWLLGIV